MQVLCAALYLNLVAERGVLRQRNTVVRGELGGQGATHLLILIQVWLLLPGFLFPPGFLNSFWFAAASVSYISSMGAFLWL